ncbi:hypothetical protein ACRAWD_18250 [Caulobacter segnis]
MVLAAKGAMPQRLLWASTGVKNPDYRDVLYIETLIGPDTVNTVPPEDPGRLPRPRRGRGDPDGGDRRRQSRTGEGGRPGPGPARRHQRAGRRRRQAVLRRRRHPVDRRRGKASRLRPRHRGIIRRRNRRAWTSRRDPSHEDRCDRPWPYGANIVRRLMRGGHEVVVHNRSPEPVRELAKGGAIASTDLQDMRAKLGHARSIG